MKSKKGNKKGQSDAIYARRSKGVEKKLNPFEMQVRRDKFKVLNRKSTHNVGNPLASRQKAFDRRKETIGAEYKVKNKSNVFIDRRKAGFQQKNHKESIYNLNDSEVLTHHGQTLAEVENFDDNMPDEDEMSDDEARLDGKPINVHNIIAIVNISLLSSQIHKSSSFWWWNRAILKRSQNNNRRINSRFKET